MANEAYYKFGGKVSLEGATSFFYFDKYSRLQSIVQALKYESAPQVGVALGEYTGAQLQGSDFIQGVEAIVPVPLHRRKLIQRGYNQAERIAKGLGKALHIPIRTDLIKRVQHTSTQTKKNREQRWKNMQYAFQAAKALPPSILLVDDVITTGSTLAACIQALRMERTDIEIRVFSIGIARK